MAATRAELKAALLAEPDGAAAWDYYTEHVAPVEDRLLPATGRFASVEQWRAYRVALVTCDAWPEFADRLLALLPQTLVQPAPSPLG